VLKAWTEGSLADLLDRHGLGGVAETAFPNDGWSGASLTRLVRPGDGRPFILKRTSWATDWIARSTRDHALREGFIAAMPIPLGAPLVAPYHGAAADGTAVAILMPDLSAELLGWESAASGPAIAVPALERVLDAVARLHLLPWPIADADDATHVWPSAPLRERLLLLAPSSSERLASEGVGAGERFRAGWAAFDRLGSADARGLIERLDGDAAPLLQALAGLPRTGIHGDLKLANVALLDDGRVALIDWQLTALAPLAVELGWLLVVNSGVLPEPPEAVLERYRKAAEAAAGSPVGGVAPFDPLHDFAPAAVQAVLGDDPEPRLRSVDRIAGDWATQRDLAWIVGLLLRGWRKGLDAASGLVLPSGVSAADDLAWWCARAVEAAGRRL
jgi:hypothetical protein